MFECEAQVGRVERSRASDILGVISDAVHAFHKLVAEVHFRQRHYSSVRWPRGSWRDLLALSDLAAMQLKPPHLQGHYP